MQALVIANGTSIRFPVNNVLDKLIQLVAFLEDYLEIDLPGIGLQGFLPFETFRVGMNIVTVEKTNNLQSF